MGVRQVFLNHLHSRQHSISYTPQSTPALSTTSRHI